MDKGENQAAWQIPRHDSVIFKPKACDYCVVVPVLNEGQRIQTQLQTMAELASQVDIVIADGDSQDNSLNQVWLKHQQVRALLIKKDHGRLSAQLRMAYAFALQEGYAGVVTIDGNGKDNVEAIPAFIQALQQGYDFVQGSRFVAGGRAINTPWLRLLAIRGLHAPIISLLAGQRFTDTTNGYRAYSRRLLLDQRVQPFRNCFQSYELLAYMSVRPTQLGMKAKEIGVTRSYPAKGKIPTKIKLGGWLNLMVILMRCGLKQYHPSRTGT